MPLKMQEEKEGSSKESNGQGNEAAIDLNRETEENPQDFPLGCYEESLTKEKGKAAFKHS